MIDSRPAVLLSSLFLFATLAACIGNANVCAVHVPTPTPGTYTFAAEGNYEDIWLPGGADWRVVNPASKNPQGRVNLPAGSTLQVALADDPADTVDAGAQIRPGIRASYWVSRPDEPKPLPVHDEVLDAKNGEVLHVTFRNLFAFENGKSWNGVRYLVDGRQPSLLLSSLFWNRTMEGAMDERFSFIEQLAIPGKRLSPTISLTSGSPTLHEGQCQILFEGEISKRYGPLPFQDYRVAFRLEDGLALPRTFEFEREGEKLFTLQLTSAPGGATPFDWKSPAEAKPPSPMPRDAIETAMTGNDPNFPTPFPEAITAARADPAVASWHDSHRDAVWLRITHRMGEPSSNILDEWKFVWSTKDGTDGFAATVQQRTMLILWTEIVVSSNPEPGARTLGQTMPPLSELARAHMSVYGQPADYLDFDFSDMGDLASISTHNASGQPRAGTDGIGLTKVGLWIWMSEGWLLQEDSFSEAGVGSPVKPAR